MPITPQFSYTEVVCALPTASAANRMNGPGWLRFFPYRKDTGEEGKCQRTAKIGCSSSSAGEKSPFLTACRQCPLVLCLWTSLAIVKRNSKAPVQDVLVAQADGHRPLSPCAWTWGGCGCSSPWRSCWWWQETGATMERGNTEESPFDTGNLSWSPRKKWDVGDLQGCPLPVVPYVLSVATRISASLYQVHVGKLPYNPSCSAGH